MELASLEVMKETLIFHQVVTQNIAFVQNRLVYVFV